MERFRNKIKSRGARGIMGLGRLFRIYDDNGNGSLDIQEATKGLEELRIGLTSDQINTIFAEFDRNGDGTIDYEEFLRGIRGEMNQFRKALAMKAFAILDKDHSGVIDIRDIKGVYNATKHPDVISGKKTEDQVLFEFLDTFESHHSDSVEDKRDGSVT